MPNIGYLSHGARHLEKYYDNLKRLQLEAARIVTGTHRNASKQLIYTETGWETLSKKGKYNV